MDKQLELAIRELERTTKDLLSTASSDLAALDQALRRRAEAIQKVAHLIEQGVEPPEPAGVERLRAAELGGKEAGRRLESAKQETMTSRRQLSQLLRGLDAMGAAAPPRGEIDYMG